MPLKSYRQSYHPVRKRIKELKRCFADSFIASIPTDRAEKNKLVPINSSLALSPTYSGMGALSFSINAVSHFPKVHWLIVFGGLTRDGHLVNVHFSSCPFPSPCFICGVIVVGVHGGVRSRPETVDAYTSYFCPWFNNVSIALQILPSRQQCQWQGCIW